MGEMQVGAGGQAAGVQGAKEPSAKDRINELTKFIANSDEFKGFEDALKKQGIDHIEFGDPAKKYNVPFSAKERDGVARALATIVDKFDVIPDLEHPKAPGHHDLESAKAMATGFLSGQTDALNDRKDLPPAATDVTLRVAQPDFTPQTIDMQ